jgi:phytoene dehydrogenase-like protein
VGRYLLELAEMSPVDIITEHFEHDKVRALMLYASCMWGLDPRETGIGFFVPLMLDRAMNKCYCYGGSHKFGSALGRAVIKNGGLLLESAGVNKILMENGRAVGVTLDEGRTIKAKVVMSTLDPHTTFLDLVGAEHLPGDLKSMVEGWKWEKWSFNTVHIAAEEPPKYACDDNFINDSFMTIVGIEGFDHLLEHWDNVVSGKIGDNFGGHCTCESLFDPTLSDRPGKYVSMFQMHAPYDLEGGWVERGAELQKKILAKWRKAAPNLTPENILASTMEDPLDIEIRFPQMRRGSIKHGAYTPIQLGCFRPNQECSNAGTPIEGLYVCGASVYPGGLMIGGPGYLGANKVAEDLDVKKWWRPTSEMERYIKTYLE